MKVDIQISDHSHSQYAEAVCNLIETSAKIRGTGIARRQPAYIREKMKKGQAVIALHDGTLAGFCYVEVWSHGKYVANSGLVVAPEFRQMGLAASIKKKAFNLARDLFPEARVFGITTSLAVMKINSRLGYQPVTFSELTPDETFWQGCQSCPNYDILQRNQRKLCLCTGMLAPSKVEAMKMDLGDRIITPSGAENPTF